jgi:hypothetical protein
VRGGAVLSAVLLCATTASAADDPPYPSPLAPPPAVSDEAPPAAVQPPPQPVYIDPDAGPKQWWVAALLSLGATAGPPVAVALIVGDRDGNGQYQHLDWTVLVSGMIGPSVGHIYAGKVLTPGLVVRTLGFGAVVIAAIDRSNAGTNEDKSLGLLLIGSGCAIGGVIYDLVTVGTSVRDYNFEHAKRRMLPTIAPVVGAGGQTSGVQLGLAGTF